MLSSCVLTSWPLVCSLHVRELSALFSVRRGTRVSPPHRSAAPWRNSHSRCCNTIKYESPRSRRWDLWECKCHVNWWGGGVAGRLTGPFTRNKHTPRQELVPLSAARLSAGCTGRPSQPIHPSVLPPIQQSSQPAQLSSAQLSSVQFSSVQFSQSVSQSAPRQPAVPPSLRRLRAARRSTQGSWSHYADSEPGCRAKPAREDAIGLKVRLLSVFLFFNCRFAFSIGCCLHGWFRNRRWDGDARRTKGRMEPHLFYIFWIIRFNRTLKHEQRCSCLLTAVALDEAARTPHHSGCTSLLKHLSVAVQASLTSQVFVSCCLMHPCEIGLF